MSKKLLIILGVVVAATIGVVIITQPGLKKGGDRVPSLIPLSGIEGQESVYFRIQLSSAGQVAKYVSKGIAKMPAPDLNISAESLPVPIIEDVTKSFPGYKIKDATMFVTEDVTTYEVVIAKGSKTKTLVYEVYESMEAAQAAGFGSFIVKKR